MSPLLAQSGVLLRRANLVAFGAKRTLLVTQLPIAARCHAQCARRAARSLASSCFQLFRPRLSRQAKAAASACLSAITARHLKGSTLRSARSWRFSATLKVASNARRARASYRQEASAKTPNAIGTVKGMTVTARPKRAAHCCSSSSSRVAAGAAGFLHFTQSRERPER